MRKRSHRRRSHDARRRLDARKIIRLPTPRVDISEDRTWFAVRTAPMTDRSAVRDLEAIGMATWRPVEAFQRIWHAKPRRSERSPTPGWIFTGAEDETDASSLWRVLVRDLRTRHVDRRTVLRVCGPIPRDELQGFADRVSANVEAKQIEPGQRATVREGPLAGVHATIIAIKRNQVLASVYMLGQRRQVTLGLDNLVISGRYS